MANLTKMKSLDDWLIHISQLHPSTIELGLDRVRQVYDRMAISPSCPVITVAGTNGKGSSVAMLSSILITAGYQVGVYTSPHLVRYNERVAMNGTPVDDQLLCDGFAAVEKARQEVSLTYFEFGTLCAFWCFSRQALDAWVLETGLGGRLDAVNILDADVALITCIGLDHQQWLGNDRETIAREKAGILRAGQTAVCCDPDPPAAIQAVADSLDTRLWQLGQDFTYSCTPAGTWDWQAGDLVFPDLAPPVLAGRFQLDNAAGVLASLTLADLPFSIGHAAIDTGLSQVDLPGRFQLLPTSTSFGYSPVYLDVAHNADSAQALASILASQQKGRTLAVWGMLRDKDMEAVARIMKPHVDHWYLAPLPGDRGADTTSLKKALHGAGISETAISSAVDVASACRTATKAATDDDRVLVFGSFETVGGILSQLEYKLV